MRDILIFAASCLAMIGCIGLFWLGLDLLRMDGWCIIGGVLMIAAAGGASIFGGVAFSHIAGRDFLS